MKQQNCRILENKAIAKDTYRMVLEGDGTVFSKPGMFLDLQVPGYFLRRPISILDHDGNTISIIYKVIGHGTQTLATMERGMTLDTLLGLGNGYDTTLSGNHPTLIGGGSGIPPLYGLAKTLKREGKDVRVILGFNQAEDVFCVDEFKALGCDVVLVTADGSLGRKGFGTDYLDDEPYTYLFACGPLMMLRTVDRIAKTSGQFSMEKRMGCGYGCCMGCSQMTTEGPKRVCKEGPVFIREEIVW